MTADEIIESRIQPIAKEGFEDALEILQLISLMRAQNTNNVNKGLSAKGAGRAALVARNAFISRLTLLVVRCYARPKDRDLHIRTAFEIIAKDSRVREELQRRNPSGALNDAEALWLICRGDERLGRLTHFRNKYTAHLSEPDINIPLPKYDDLFPFAIETTKVMAALARATGVNNHNLVDWDGELNGSAKASWKPWAS